MTAATAPPLSRPRPTLARSAGTRVFCATLLVGALGLGGAVFVLIRLLGTWRIAHAAAHHIVLLGQPVAYPTANAGAVVVLVLALVGLWTTAAIVLGAVSELARSARTGRRLARIQVGVLAEATLIDAGSALAFCAGLIRPKVYVSTATLALLEEPALNAVLAHERQHARRRDPLRLAAGRILRRALVFVPGFDQLIRRQATLTELGADEAVLHAPGTSRAALAQAMLAFTDSSTGAGIETERIDFLLGEGSSWSFPVAVVLVAAGGIALLGAVGALASRVASGSATLAPPFLSAEPCVIVLALIPAMTALLAFRLALSR